MEKSRFNHKLFSAFFAAFLIAVDQLTKYICRTCLPDSKVIDIIPGFLRFNHVENTGIAFGSFGGLYSIIVPITVVITLACIFLVAFNKVKSPAYIWGLSIIIGGAVGNMIDRVAFGFVTDFIDFYGIWPYVFNVADCGVVIGAGVIIIYEITAMIRDKRKGKDSAEG